MSVFSKQLWQAIPHSAENWCAVSHKQYFLTHWFLNICPCVFKNTWRWLLITDSYLKHVLASIGNIWSMLPCGKVWIKYKGNCTVKKTFYWKHTWWSFFLVNQRVYFNSKVLWKLLYVHLSIKACALNWKNFKL